MRGVVLRRRTARGFARPPWLTANANTLLDDLVSHWDCDEASGTRADSHGSYDLTDNNTVTSRTGKISNAADFNDANSEYLSRSSHEAALAADGGFTFGCWVYIDDALALYDVAGQLYSGTDGSWVLRSQKGKPRLVITDGTAPKMATWGSDISGGWHYVDCGYDPTGNVGWVNVDRGTRVTVDCTGFTPQEGTRPFVMGARADGGARYLDGAIDEAAFWSVVKSSSDLDAAYNSGSGLAYSSWGGSGGGAGVVVPVWAIYAGAAT